MKNLFTAFVALFLMGMVQAQECKTYALHWDLNENKEFITSLDPLTGEVIKLNFIPEVEVIQHGFSAINADQGLYYFYGIDNQFNGKLYSMSLINGEIEFATDFPPANINGNIIEMHFHPFDGLMYALHWDMIEEMEYFVSINPVSGEVNKIQSLDGVKQIQSDFSALNYQNDLYYFIGVDADFMYRLYTIDVNTGEILNNPVFPSNNINGGVNELEVDPNQGKLYSLHYDQVEMMEYFVEINPFTAEVNKMSSLPGIQYIQAGFSALNSQDGQYYFYGIDENYEGIFQTIDIYTGELINSVDIFGDFYGGLNELQFPNISVVPPLMSHTSICNSDSALILAPEGFQQYQWSNGITEDHIYVSDSLAYSATLVKDYGCELEINPMPLQVFNCEDYTESLVQMHDTCLFDPNHIALSYISNIELNGSEIHLQWNFVSIHNDTISLASTYEISENGLYELVMGFNCDEKSDAIMYSNMLSIEHLDPTATKNLNLKSYTVFPNPVKNVLTIASLSASETHLKIFNSAQQLIMERVIEDQSSHVNLQELPAGIYLLVLESNDGIQTTKLVKN
jgi:hypothetical protein